MIYDGGAPSDLIHTLFDNILAFTFDALLMIGSFLALLSPGNIL